MTNFISDEILFEFLQALVLFLERVGPALHHRCAFWRCSVDPKFRVESTFYHIRYEKNASEAYTLTPWRLQAPMISRGNRNNALWVFRDILYTAIQKYGYTEIHSPYIIASRLGLRAIVPRSFLSKDKELQYFRYSNLGAKCKYRRFPRRLQFQIAY